VGLGTYVAREHRGVGLSNAMRQAAKEHCRNKGYKFVSGAVLLGNEAGKYSAAASGGEITGYTLRWAL
jgi:predicted GNAT family acetyltransferase